MAAATVAVTRRFEHGEPILHQGCEVSSLYLVVDGAVRLAAISPSGRQVVVGLLGRGELFGESALVGGPTPVEARAVGRATVGCLPLETVDAVLRYAPSTAGELLRMIAERLHRTAIALEEALAHDVPTRVTRRLCELAERHGIPGAEGIRVAVPLTQEDLGRMVGASREAVNRSLGALASRGLVRSDGRAYVIPDLEALAGSVERGAGV